MSKYCQPVRWLATVLIAHCHVVILPLMPPVRCVMQRSLHATAGLKRTLAIMLLLNASDVETKLLASKTRTEFLSVTTSIASCAANQDSIRDDKPQKNGMQEL